MPGYLGGAAAVGGTGQHIGCAFVPSDARGSVEILVTGEPDEHVGEPQFRGQGRVIGDQFGKQRLFQRNPEVGDHVRDD
jgi:hypothetical protein